MSTPFSCVGCFYRSGSRRNKLSFKVGDVVLGTDLRILKTKYHLNEKKGTLTDEMPTELSSKKREMQNTSNSLLLLLRYVYFIQHLAFYIYYYFNENNEELLHACSCKSKTMTFFQRSCNRSVKSKPTQ